MKNTIVRLLLQVSRRLLTFAEFNFFSRVLYFNFLGCDMDAFFNTMLPSQTKKP